MVARLVEDNNLDRCYGSHSGYNRSKRLEQRIVQLDERRGRCHGKIGSRVARRGSPTRRPIVHHDHQIAPLIMVADGSLKRYLTECVRGNYQNAFRNQRRRD